MKVAVVNCDQNPNLASKYEIGSFPTINIFSQDKSKPKKFNGDRSITALSEAAIREIASVLKSRTGFDSVSYKTLF